MPAGNYRHARFPRGDGRRAVGDDLSGSSHQEKSKDTVGNPRSLQQARRLSNSFAECHVSSRRGRLGSYRNGDGPKASPTCGFAAKHAGNMMTLAGTVKGRTYPIIPSRGRRPRQPSRSNDCAFAKPDHKAPVALVIPPHLSPGSAGALFFPK